MSGKISNDSHGNKKNNKRLNTLQGSEAKLFNDRSKAFMSRMDQFEKEFNERFERMEEQIRNS